MDNHGADCGCHDPNARLNQASLDVLVELNNDLPTDQMSPQDIDRKMTMCLQYLKAEDVPARSQSICDHVLGQFHAHYSLSILAHICYMTRPEPDSPFATRLTQAWPGIWKWLQYTFDNWILSPMFSNQTANRWHSFQTIVVSLRSFVKLPAVCELVLADDGGKAAFIMLGSCWLYEAEDEFKQSSNGNYALTAVEPLLDLATFKPGPPPDVFFGCLLSGQDAGKPARVALDQLGWYLGQETPWEARAIFLLDYDLRMIITMSRAEPYRIALLAHHSVRTVTRILVSLTSAEYDIATAPGVAQSIASCLEYLELTLPAADGYAWTTHAVQTGLVPAMLRTVVWFADMPGMDDTAQTALIKLFRLLSLYSMYPSLLRLLVHAISGARDLNLPDAIKDNAPLWAAYLELETLVEERSALGNLDLKTNCHNPDCKKPDTNNFSSCSGCFTTMYCSQECQAEHWKSSHRAECRALRELRAEGKSATISEEDLAFSKNVVIEEVRRRKDEILKVWKEQVPEPVPVVSLNYFLDDPRGVLVVGAPSKHPPQGYAEHERVRDMWENVINQEEHREHIVVGAYLPNGSEGKLHFFSLDIDPRASEGTVVERLIKTVELM
ncbi:hypothetical protein FB45DRAFT_1028551 [Roridomyces roridus]|uniref:MYND-type domain-containing protein n=1 Tax=Roridomyces roridus TaxID=1738132 RepID=A0AAD7FJW4_9AGAR|nr:hypothetical protein FB45DRAFT_1028551 [Roridomyces roridus]